MKTVVQQLKEGSKNVIIRKTTEGQRSIPEKVALVSIAP